METVLFAMGPPGYCCRDQRVLPLVREQDRLVPRARQTTRRRRVRQTRTQRDRSVSIFFTDFTGFHHGYTWISKVLDECRYASPNLRLLSFWYQ